MQFFFLFAECASDPVTGLSATTGRYEVIRLGGFFMSRGTLPLYSPYCTGMADREGAPNHDCLLDAKTPEQTPNPPHCSSLRGVLSQAEAHEPGRVMDCTIKRSESTGSADARVQYVSRSVSSDGLTDGYTPFEGYSQGNPFSANGYQGTSVLASSTLPFPRRIFIPPWPSPSALPITRVCYSDDGAFFEPTIALVSELASACVQATLHTNGVPNMDKLEFSFIRLNDEGGPALVAEDVPRFKTRTLTNPPLIVGVPILHSLIPTVKLADLLATFRTFYHSVRDTAVSPLLAVRSFVAFALSRWDYVFSAVLALPEWHRDLQVYAHRAYRAAFALPPWTCSTFLHPPLHAGGVNCPHLPTRNLSLLFQTYLLASLSRNPLSRASAKYLLESQAPFSEGLALRSQLALWRTRVHTHPFPHLTEAHIRCSFTTAAPLPDVLWIVTDGALTATAIGGGIIFYHPDWGIQRSFRFSFQVVKATSTDAEWLPKLVARHLLQTWMGHAYFLADATAAMHCAFTKAPPRPPLPTTSSARWSLPLWVSRSTGCRRNTTQATHTPQPLCSEKRTSRLPASHHRPNPSPPPFFPCSAQLCWPPAPAVCSST